MKQQDKYRGCLLGLAVGDALGTTLEFKSPGSFPPISEMIGGGPFRLKPGQWTDDTSMALCLAASLIEKKGFDAHDQMQRYARWWKEGYMSSTGRCFDIGNTVRAALARFQESGTPFAGSTDQYSAGNGSLMRLAPVPLFFSTDAAKAIKVAGESSKTTHGGAAAIDACRYFAGLIVGALNGTPKEELVSPLYSPVPQLWEQQPLCKEVAEVAGGSFKAKQPPTIRGTGYVVQSMEAALWAFHHSSSFREGALLAVNLGDDADTTGAIYGQLAGAFYGEVAIPEEWLSKLHGREMIDDLATGLMK